MSRGPAWGMQGTLFRTYSGGCMRGGIVPAHGGHEILPAGGHEAPHRFCSDRRYPMSASSDRRDDRPEAERNDDDRQEHEPGRQRRHLPLENEQLVCPPVTLDDESPDLGAKRLGRRRVIRGDPVVAPLPD
jgi:hypothetical protein